MTSTKKRLNEQQIAAYRQRWTSQRAVAHLEVKDAMADALAMLDSIEAAEAEVGRLTARIRDLEQALAEARRMRPRRPRLDADLCVYVAGPLSGDEEGNVARAIEAGLGLIARGHHPLVPHMSIHLAAVAEQRGVPVPYERWMSICFAWLSEADAILYLAPSPGADRELVLAEQLGLRVFRSVDEVPVVRGGRMPEEGVE